MEAPVISGVGARSTQDPGIAGVPAAWVAGRSTEEPGILRVVAA